MAKRIVVALGGNALQTANNQSTQDQMKVAEDTAAHLAQLVIEGYELVITHGNGPQVGAILLNEENSVSPAPLDTCSAMSQGQIGYWLQQAMINKLHMAGMQRSVVALVTQTIVDKNDKAFQDPSKPIGPFYASKQEAEAIASERQFTVKEDAGRGWRRVVPSPKPLDIVEKDVIRAALQNGTIVIAAGGGGIPVVNIDGTLTGVAAVIDKDFTAAKLAALIDADILMILTGVDKVRLHYGTPNEVSLDVMTVSEASAYSDQGQFAPGSMLPKVQAAVQFAASAPQKKAIITAANSAIEALRGATGTVITNN